MQLTVLGSSEKSSIPLGSLMVQCEIHEAREGARTVVLEMSYLNLDQF